MELTKRIGSGIHDITNWIRNWAVYSLVILVLIGGCLFISGAVFNKWYYHQPFSSSYKNNVQNILYIKGWYYLFAYQTDYKEKLNTQYHKYYYDYYAPKLKQLRNDPEQLQQYEEQLNKLVDDQVAKYSAVALPEGFVMKLMFSTFTPLGFLALLAFFMRAPLSDFRPFQKDESLHGDAKWASERDITKAGLRAKKGIIIGRDSRGYLVAPGFQHCLLFAPTGSGKGVGMVIPNLLFWEESVFIHDIKLENYEITSGYRREVMKQDVFLWNPASPDGLTHCYNPFDWISKKPGQMVDDVQKIANLILPEQEFWNNEARSLFVGVALYLQAVPEKVKSFGEVVRTLRSDDVVYNLAVVLDTAFLQKADKERSGVVSTLNSGLELWANPLIDTATASSDFNVQDFKRKKTTVYVGLTPDNIQRLQPLLQVFYQQATEFLVRKIPDKKTDPYGVLFLMDEFPTLGEMKQFHAGIAYFRGYNVRLLLVVQDTQQLKGIYEEHGMNTFLSNSTYRITYAANNVETANLISQLIGNKTVKQKSMNKPKYLDLNPATRTIHESEIQRALLLPQEVIGLPRDEQIILIESTPPIKTKKITYYKERFFTSKLLDPIEIPTQEPFDPEKFKTRKQKEADKKPEPVAAATPPPPPPPPPTNPTVTEQKPVEGALDTTLDNDDDLLDFPDFPDLPPEPVSTTAETKPAESKPDDSGENKPT